MSGQRLATREFEVGVADDGDIRARLTQVFRETFDDDSIEIFDAMTVDDLDDWDSVTHITLVLGVEKEFKIRLSAAQVGALENVGAMIGLLEKHVGGAAR